MAKNLLTYRREENVAIISFAPEPIEGDNLEKVHFEFADLCEGIKFEDEVRVCVIEGIETRTFEWVVESPHGFSRWAACSKNGPSLSSSASAIDVPLIVGMEGNIAGPGLELALFCDVRLSTPSSQFRFPHVAMGWTPFDGATQMLPRLIGRGRALEILLTGSLIEAGEAREIGLIHYVVNSGDLHTSMYEMAAKMASNSPISLTFTKEAITKGMEMSLDQGLRLEADLYFLLQSAEDRIEGISAFKEKRKPLFKGQ